MTVKYSEDHEYIRIEGTTGFVGITDYAQGQLGDIVFVELPAAGKQLKKGDEAAVVESVKAASEIYSPVSGAVVGVNDKLSADPALVNQDPLGEGWIFQVELSDLTELDGLMDEAAYAEFAR